MTKLLVLSALLVGAIATTAPNGSEKWDVALSVTPVSSSIGGATGTPVVQIEPCKTHEVTVGGAAGLVFSPSTINAAAGDMVKFNFMSVNHTVTQSIFDQPCAKMADGVDSGFMPNPNNTINPAPNSMYQVMDTKPTWWYCKQKSHCGKGMVFSINPTAEKTHAQFLSMAMAQNGTAASPANANSMSISSAAPPASENGVAMSSIPPPAAAASPSTTTTIASSAAAPPPAASQPAASPPVASSAAASPSAAVQSNPMIVSGTGSKQGDACSCSCLCGVAPFPADAGMDNFGGMSGSMPMV